jgi:hypothetical protein
MGKIPKILERRSKNEAWLDPLGRPFIDRYNPKSEREPLFA